MKDNLEIFLNSQVRNQEYVIFSFSKSSLHMGNYSEFDKINQGRT
jgi:hypothetical protein